MSRKGADYAMVANFKHPMLKPRTPGKDGTWAMKLQPYQLSLQVNAMKDNVAVHKKVHR